MIEEWRPIQGWAGHDASDHGRIRSVDRVITFPDGRSRFARGMIIKPQKRSGYHVVQVGRATRYVHDIVLETFIGEKPEGGCVRHGPCGPLLNAVWNICYGTKSENERDKVRDGTHHQTAKTHCPRRHAYDAIGQRSTGTYRYCKRCKDAQRRGGVAA